MGDVWIRPERVFDGENLLSGVGICLRDGVVAQVGPVPDGVKLVTVNGTICPGFIDLQVNGGGGTLLNNDPTPEGIATIANAHRTFGSTTTLPTVITDEPAVLQAAVAAVLESEALGLHIEGPHIAPSKRGTHSEAHIRPMNKLTLNALKQLRQAGKVVILTLAPEMVPAEVIGEIRKLGVIMSLGHTDATADQMRSGFVAGASMVTHLYNAMSPMMHRAPGAVGAAINSDAYVGIIADGHHVDDAMIGLAVRGRPVPDRMFLVSDAMATVGGPDSFELYGQCIRVENGRLVNSEGNLAGAHGTMLSGVQRLVRHVGLPLDQALRMATSVPACAIARPDMGALLGRSVEDVLVLDQQLELTSRLDQLIG